MNGPDWLFITSQVALVGGYLWTPASAFRVVRNWVYGQARKLWSD